jgi:beta-lactamase class A
MFHSRREFLTGAAAIIGTAPLTMAASTADVSGDIVSLFEPLPGTKSLKIYAPATKGKPKFLLEFNSSAFLFVGSVIKTFVLCEALRQADSPDIVQTISQRQLPLNEAIWNIDSPTLNPPHLAGEISERTALEAMIMHSDNTGTDMSFKLVGPTTCANLSLPQACTTRWFPTALACFSATFLAPKTTRTSRGTTFKRQFATMIRSSTHCASRKFRRI